MDPLLGQIIMFGGNFAPRGWAMCNGQLLSIAQNSALFAILGTTYGGDGVTNFGLPNLQSRVPIGMGQGQGLSRYDQGESGGVESVILNQNQIPAHVHQIQAAGEKTSDRPKNNVPAVGGSYSSSGSGDSMASTSSYGGGQAHENMQPFIAMNYIIALEGIFPSRP